ncbi:transcriptional regulator with XRE-family HTH domain [Actinoplanes lutulentus]|uniref:helix-turn-helix domain-containing protein n=1 Tax=Actinoplanes lutulentus TaxID=1287878 RepID=UPI0015EBD62B|nr:helix-turn-helix transcriptional regulator [Actinoplanes lutulentus]MBB2940309.1 transcriptional regulator with XRE-family HTH domain [Actinoplanes lutulentus]
MGAILFRWRKRQKLTGLQLGKRVGMSQAKISRLETGAVAAEPGDVRLLAEALGVPPGEAELAIELAEHAGERLIEWVPAGRDQAERQREIGRAEAAAKEIRILQPAVVPGLLQTSEYARAVLSAHEGRAATGSNDAAVTEAVIARQERNRILHSPAREFHFLITEQVLRVGVGGPAVMISQIDRMREVAGFPNVRLSVITDEAELPIPIYHGFFVADDRWVSVDLFTALLRATGRTIVRDYRELFDQLESAARSDIDDLLDHYQARYVGALQPKSVAR